MSVWQWTTDSLCLPSRVPDVVVVLPDLPIKLQIYRCSKVFETDYIKTLFDDHNVNLLIMLNGDTCNVIEQKHTACVEIASFHTHRTSNTRRGGQSANRYARNRDIELNDFVSTFQSYLNHLVLYEKTYNNIYVGGYGTPYEKARFAFEVTEKISLDELNVHKMISKITIVKTIDITHIKTLLETNPDKLMYGCITTDDIPSIKSLYITNEFKEKHHVLLNEYKIHAPKLVINISNDQLIVDFGGLIGVMF